MLLGVALGSTLWPLLFIIFLNNLSDKIDYSKFLLFTSDLKSYQNIKSVEDCKAIEVDINAVQEWGGENFMELNTQKTIILSFTCKNTAFTLNTMSETSQFFVVTVYKT
jgi:hypothetical protein